MIIIDCNRDIAYRVPQFYLNSLRYDRMYHIGDVPDSVFTHIEGNVKYGMPVAPDMQAFLEILDSPDTPYMWLLRPKELLTKLGITFFKIIAESGAHTWPAQGAIYSRRMIDLDIIPYCTKQYVE